MTRILSNPRCWYGRAQLTWLRLLDCDLIAWNGSVPQQIAVVGILWRRILVGKYKCSRPASQASWPPKPASQPATQPTSQPSQPASQPARPDSIRRATPPTKQPTRDRASLGAWHMSSSPELETVRHHSLIPHAQPDPPASRPASQPDPQKQTVVELHKS